jgi:hypothetical protein
MATVIESASLSWRDFELGRAVRPHAGELKCGDAVWWRAGEGEVHVAVIDGVGHGPAAATAAQGAVQSIEGSDFSDLLQVMTNCDEALRASRGASVTLLRVRADGTVAHSAVGDIALAFHGQRPSQGISRPGVVGDKPRKLSLNTFTLERGALLAIYTDGVSRRLELAECAEQPVERVARTLIERWGRDHDDASCVVIKRRHTDC